MITSKILKWGVLLLAVLCTLACTPQPEPAKLAASTQTKATQQAGNARVVAEGRLVTYPGAEVIISAEQSGVILKLPVDEKSRVRKGDLVAELKADELRAGLGEAKAKIAEAEADSHLAGSEVARAEKLWDMQMGSKQLLDRASRDRDAAAARLNTVKASVRRLEAALAKSRILSPMDGVVITRHVTPGEMVEAGTRLMTIADLSRIRIEAEVDEYDSGRVKLGSPVLVSAEGFAGAWKGKVEEIPDAVTPRRLRPQDPGKPSDTRVLLVKVALQEPTPLRLGQRVEVTIQAQ